MDDNYRIHINFLPITCDLPSFRIYRRQRSQQEPKPSEQIMGYSLPIHELKKDSRKNYWVSLSPYDDFCEFNVQPSFNHDLTRWLLFQGLCDAARRSLQSRQYSIPKHSFITELSFIMHHHTEGDELLVVQPYFLRVDGRFGCLVDFHFRLAENVSFSRRVQQLSLSLDRGFRRNLDYYADRISRIQTFVQERRPVLSDLRLPGSDVPIILSDDFISLPAHLLHSRSYIFANGREHKSQFTGLRNYGPLQPLQSRPHLLFAFREQDRQAARTLALALRGSPNRERFNFPGFQALFKTDIDIDHKPVVLPDFSENSIQNFLQRARQDGDITIPIFLLPEGQDDVYLRHKAIFAHSGIPTQVCTLPVIQNENTLKWSIANIALQVYCKAGGQPWKVQPTNEQSLIIGISQSHKTRNNDPAQGIEKYFAFSVMTDSSGLFQQIQVLGDAQDEETYLQKLKAKLKKIIDESVTKFSRVVIHTSFKLRRAEINTIHQTVVQAAGNTDPSQCRFAVVKVNHRHRFFGINRAVNSLVPFEATKLQLGAGEYLLWFEGIFPDKPNVTKAFPGPTHIQFLHINDIASINDDVLLQDLINLSGANWRGFNAKSAPVSVFYCHLVADLVHEFHQSGLPLPKIQDLRPWFL